MDQERRNSSSPLSSAAQDHPKTPRPLSTAEDQSVTFNQTGEIYNMFFAPQGGGKNNPPEPTDRMFSRRKVLKILAISGSIVVGTGAVLSGIEVLLPKAMARLVDRILKRFGFAPVNKVDEAPPEVRDLLNPPQDNKTQPAPVKNDSERCATTGEETRPPAISLKETPGTLLRDFKQTSRQDIYVLRPPKRAAQPPLLPVRGPLKLSRRAAPQPAG